MSDEEKEKFSKSYCPLAWTHNFINQDGSYQVCCTSEEFDNHIRDDQGKKIFISDPITSKEVMNTSFMKDIRKKMMDGKWPALCKRCLITENHGGISRRNIEIDNYSEDNESFLESTNEDGSTNAPITSADYRLGNLCNLQCRMCNPRSTKLWIKEWNDMKPQRETFDKETMDSYEEYFWIDSERLIQDVEEKAATLTHLHFAGGEPLLVPQMSKILQTCIEADSAKNITITYNTNMTILPKKVLELWKSFKSVKILASVDAVGDLNNYIRYPSKWSKIHENFHFIDQHHEEYNITECMISTTVQILNILRMEELYEYLEQFKFIVPTPNLINVHVPTYFKSTYLPPELKEIASEKLVRIKAKYEATLPDHYLYLTDNIQQIINFMNSEDEYIIPNDESTQEERGFKEFISFQKKFDQERKLDLFSFFPEFLKY